MLVALGAALGFAEWYGANLDALWDGLRDLTEPTVVLAGTAGRVLARERPRRPAGRCWGCCATGPVEERRPRRPAAGRGPRPRPGARGLPAGVTRARDRVRGRAGWRPRPARAARCGPRRRPRRASRAARAVLGQRGDGLLDLVAGAAAVDDRAQPLDLSRRRGACPGRASSSRAASASRSGVEGQGDQHGALALDEVVAGGLAGGGGVAEDAEQVVAQLEGLAQRQPERRQRGQRGRRRRRPARPRRAAAARWSTWPTCSAARSSRSRRRRGPRACTETSRNCPAITSERVRSSTSSAAATRSPGQPAAAQQLVGPGQQQVAEQDRAGGAVLLGVAAPAGGAVLGSASSRWVAGRPRRVSEASIRSSWTRALACSSSSAAQARTSAAVVSGRRAGGHGPVAPAAERRAQHLAAGDRRPRLGEQARGVGPEGGQALGLLVEEGRQRLLDGRAGRQVAASPRGRA